jgi:hypothetical protein
VDKLQSNPKILIEFLEGITGLKSNYVEFSKTFSNKKAYIHMILKWGGGF